MNDEETWVPDTKTNTLNVFDVGDTRATSAVVEGAYTAFTCVPDDRNSGSGGIAVQYPIDVSPTLLSSEFRNAYDRGAKITGVPGPTSGATVRRLTPGECQRLQGFPFDWNAEGLDEKGKPVELSDTQRYKQAGNAVTVNVSNWIAERLLPVIEEGR